MAISVVFYYHMAHRLVLSGAGTGKPGRSLDFLMNSGMYGVELFFVISGFVLALPFVRARLVGGKPVSLRAYYLRRVTRLEPPYIIFLSAAFPLKPLAESTTYRDLWPHLAAWLIYQHNTIFGFLNPIMDLAGRSRSRSSFTFSHRCLPRSFSSGIVACAAPCSCSSSWLSASRDS